MANPPEIHNLTELMLALKVTKRELEKLILRSLKAFEENTGLTIHDVELVRVMDPKSSRGSPKLGSIKIDLRLSDE